MSQKTFISTVAEKAQITIGKKNVGLAVFNSYLDIFFPAGFCDLIVGHTDTHTHLIAK